MNVKKRDGTIESVSFDKVLRRISKLSEDLSLNCHEIAQRICSRIYDGVSTHELDELTAQLCSSRIAENPDYDKLASRIIISNHQKKTSPSFSETVNLLASNSFKVISDDLVKIIETHKDKLNSHIDYSRDYLFDYFGFKTLERSYLMRKEDRIVERPQHMLMRVALGIHGWDIKDALETYDYMSTKRFIHATPTLFNYGTPRPQGSSCFLLHMNDDSIAGIYDSLSECAAISKYAGGIGLHIHNIRAKNSVIRGTNGKSDGIVPMLRVFNSTARYVNQCFSPETLIYTSKSIKPISKITPGERVITRDGTFRQVLEVTKRTMMNKLLFRIDTPLSLNPIFVTKEHEICVMRLNAEDEYEECFVSCHDLFGDIDETYVGYPKYAFDRNVADDDFHPKEYHALGLTVRNHGWNDSIHKALIESCYLASRESTTEFLRGRIFESDFVDGKTVVYNLDASEAHFLRYMLYKVGVFCSGTTKDNDRCEIEFNNSEHFKGILQLKEFVPKNVLEKDGMYWTPITSIQEILYDGTVYDLNVEDNHNYTVANLGLVHNSGKRNGSIAVYLEPWHADIRKFLEMRKNHGNEEERARDLFYALWIPDLFMRRVKNNEMWSLMCPDQCPGMSDVYGEEFEELYERYEREGRYIEQIKAQTLWINILESQIETGTPYMLYKDSVNRKSNQSNLGTIKSSNLCCEIVEYTSPDEIAVCNLASLCLPSFVKTNQEGGKAYDFDELGKAVGILTKNLNKIIDKNFYPLEKARRSNLRHRPIALGVQGLSDTYMMMRFPYESEEAQQLNRDIFETIYYHAVEMSMRIAQKRAEAKSQENTDYDLRANEFDRLEGAYPGAYSTFEGSPLSEGRFQFDMWGVTPSDRYDWQGLRTKIKEWGVRNSLFVAPMPTASTAQIMGFTESFEVPTSNIFTRNTMAGNFIVVNKYLMRDLIERGLWSTSMKEKILLAEGSIGGIEEIPQDIRDLYKTSWEIKQRVYIDQAKDRGAFVCQSQSMNLFIDNPTLNKMNSVHFYAWESGLKTGMYYLRTKPRASAQRFSIDPSKIQKSVRCDEEVCEACSA